ncbi:MAG: hypothetical protein KAR56_04545 [Thermoplasmata archaeon]|nr:hypothetical protein [Thermoplasmata archaeon]
MDGNKEQKLNRLRQKLADIESRRQQILEEIIQLESNTTDVFETDVQTTISNTSPTEDKIRLFRSLFGGGRDVYPRRVKSIKTGKSGYQLEKPNQSEVGSLSQ